MLTAAEKVAGKQELLPLGSGGFQSMNGKVQTPLDEAEISGDECSQQRDLLAATSNLRATRLLHRIQSADASPPCSKKRRDCAGQLRLPDPSDPIQAERTQPREPADALDQVRLLVPRRAGAVCPPVLLAACLAETQPDTLAASARLGPREPADALVHIIIIIIILCTCTV